MKPLNAFLILFVLLIFASCDNEDVDDFSQLTTADLISEESNLFSLLDRVVTDNPESIEITCIEFVYSFVVVVYDANLQVVASQTVSNNGQFSTLLADVGEDEFISLSFPITSELENGTSFEINNKEELEIAINDCKEEQEQQVIGECTNLLLDCVWEVTLPEDIAFSTYTDAVFDNDNNGATTLYNRGESYNGTWTVYFIDDELHININLQGEGDIQTDWNVDWKTEVLGQDIISILNDAGESFLLSKECDEANYCTVLDFEKCVENGEAVFTLSDYDECVIVIAAPQQEVDETTGEVSDLVDWQITYHDTQMDAEAAINELLDVYTLLGGEASQTVFARVENPVSQEFILAPVTLSPVDCE